MDSKALCVALQDKQVEKRKMRRRRKSPEEQEDMVLDIHTNSKENGIKRSSNCKLR